MFFTDVGERVLIIFRNILNDLQKVDELIAAEQGLEIGKVHIGAYPTACTRFIPKIIRTMEDLYPGLEIKISEGSVDQVKDWLRSKTVDVGMIIPPEEDFDIVPLMKDQLIVVMHSSHPLYLKERIDIFDLQDEDIIIGRGGYELQIHSLFKDLNLKPKVRFVIDYIDTALCMVQEGLGITITTKKNILSLPKDVVFRELKPNTYRDIGIAVSNMDDISKATEVLIQTACSLFKNDD